LWENARETEKKEKAHLTNPVLMRRKKWRHKKIAIQYSFIKKEKKIMTSSNAAENKNDDRASE
jgi:hypothetical protein